MRIQQTFSPLLHEYGVSYIKKEKMSRKISDFLRVKNNDSSIYQTPYYWPVFAVFMLAASAVTPHRPGQTAKPSPVRERRSVQDYQI